MAASLSQKLQMKPGQRLLAYVRPPDVSLDVPGVVDMPESPHADLDETAAVLVFATRRDEAEERAPLVARVAARDGLAWMAYPKAGRLGTDLNRDKLRELMSGHGADAVRQVAIDDTWSALRFRAAP